MCVCVYVPILCTLCIGSSSTGNCAFYISHIITPLVILCSFLHARDLFSMTLTQCLCAAAAAQQRVRQRRSRTRPVLHLPAYPSRGGRAWTAAARRVCDRRLRRSVWSRLSPRLFQTQVLSLSIVLAFFCFLYLILLGVTDRWTWGSSVY